MFYVSCYYCPLRRCGSLNGFSKFLKCSSKLLSPPAAAEETFTCVLQHRGSVHSLGSEDQENRK